MSKHTLSTLAIQSAALTFLVIAGTGCPIQNTDYDAGFIVGFAEDDWYWQGYDDSYATLFYSPVYYQGGDIPYVETPIYDQGYWDGVWYAYNDGYFVCYDYAFTIGFSEGYDTAYYSGFLTFLANDAHVENDNGGWGDGYNDGFSEGRIFGAADFEQGLPFDWMDALLDYRSGTDLYFEEIDLGTGVYGPVILYEYGWDPTTAKSLAPAWTRGCNPLPAIRAGVSLKADEPPALSYRPLTETAEQQLDKCPLNTDRSALPLTLTTTWLERINAYRLAIQNPQFPTKSLRGRSIPTATD